MRSKNRWGTALLALSITLCVSPAAAAGDQRQVDVGIYVNRIKGLSLKDNQFTVDFYLWFRWQGDGLAPLDQFEIVDGHVDAKEDCYETLLADGLHYASCRVTATITHFWDVRRFPLDDHVLTITVESNKYEEDVVRYVPDRENSGTRARLQVPGWSVEEPHVEAANYRHETNYGDISLSTGHESIYSRFVFVLPLARAGYGYFLKLFFALFVSTAIAFVVFFIEPGDARFSLGVGAVFAAVASEYVVTASLPSTSTLTLADIMHILTFGFIFLSIVESTLSLKWHTTADPSYVRLSRRLDHWSFVVLAAGYVGCCVLTVILC